MITHIRRAAGDKRLMKIERTVNAEILKIYRKRM
jgi:hypothetical protein